MNNQKPFDTTKIKLPRGIRIRELCVPGTYVVEQFDGFLFLGYGIWGAIDPCEAWIGYPPFHPRFNKCILDSPIQVIHLLSKIGIDKQQYITEYLNENHPSKPLPAIPTN